MTLDVERLREALSGGSAGVATLLADHPDPTVRLLSELWATRGEQEPETPETAPPADPDQETIDLVTELEATRTRERVLTRRLARARTDLERLGRFTDELAAALGACPRCWGEDRWCGECAGEGRPGGALPDRSLFGRYVAPAARRMVTARTAERADAVPEPPIEDRATITERRDP